MVRFCVYFIYLLFLLNSVFKIKVTRKKNAIVFIRNMISLHISTIIRTKSAYQKIHWLL